MAEEPTNEPTPDPAAVASLHAAAASNDLDEVKRLVTEGVPVWAPEQAEGLTPLMVACASGHMAIVRWLLENGAPWNAIDRRGRCAGNHALDHSHQTIVDFLVDAATKAELMLGAAQRESTRATAAKAAESADYLSRSVRYEGETLFDEGDDAVMMAWETPLMEAHAERLCASGGDVLNVGFGMGIIDGAIAQRKPRSHTIIEAHPGVLARMRADGWHGRDGVRVCEGRWQQAVPALLAEGVQFDAIFYDTYGEHDADMGEFHEALPKLLRPGGMYSFFNGMCPFNVFFQGVACSVVQLELQALGLSTTFESLSIDTPAEGDTAWDGVKRQYFYADTYYLPHAVLDGGAAAAAAEPATGADDVDMVDSGGAAEQLIALNGGVMRLVGHSLQTALGAAGDESIGLRLLLCEHILPHFEESGWQLLAPLSALWAVQPPAHVSLPATFMDSHLASRSEYDASLSLSDSERLAAEKSAAAAAALCRSAVVASDGIDANSAAVIIEAVGIAVKLHAKLRDQGEAAVEEEEELRLAILPNPLAADDAAAHEAAPPEAGGGGSVAAGGRDSDNRTYANAEEFGAANLGSTESRDAWYGVSSAYWGGVRADVDGMLGGLAELHEPDVEGSLAFIDELRAEGSPCTLPDGVALDCGAGIGRVSAGVLLPRFASVDLLEPSAAFLETARSTLPPSRVRAMHTMALQDFKPPTEQQGYAVVWARWVLNYLTDADLTAFLRRCADALAPNGRIVVKESVSRPANGFYVDRSDASITRTDAHFRDVFERAGLRVAHSRMQPGLPRAIFPVFMYALVPA